MFPLPSGEGARGADEGTNEACHRSLAKVLVTRSVRAFTPTPLPIGEGQHIGKHQLTRYATNRIATEFMQ